MVGRRMTSGRDGGNRNVSVGPHVCTRVHARAVRCGQAVWWPHEVGDGNGARVHREALVKQPVLVGVWCDWKARHNTHVHMHGQQGRVAVRATDSFSQLKTRHSIQHTRHAFVQERHRPTRTPHTHDRALTTTEGHVFKSQKCKRKKRVLLVTATTPDVLHGRGVEITKLSAW